MQTTEILDFAIERASAINTYRNIFIGVATAIVGVMASGKSFTGSTAPRSAMAVRRFSCFPGCCGGSGCVSGALAGFSAGPESLNRILSSNWD